MKRKIFTFACAMSGLSIVITAGLIHFAVFGTFFRSLQKNTIAAALYTGKAVEISGMDYLESLSGKNGPENFGTGREPPFSLRITLVAPDGKVIYDTAAFAEDMENHLERPEVRDALEKGAGESVRFSETMRRQTYYYALKLAGPVSGQSVSGEQNIPGKNVPGERHIPAGTILRVSNTTDSIFVSLFNLILISLGIALAVFIAGAYAASRVTRKLVEPINRIDLDHPENNQVYDELAPLLLRIKRQNEAIAAQMDEMQKRQREFSAITENMSEGLLVLDREGRVMSCNSSARVLLDVRLEHIENQHVLNVRRDEPVRNAVEKALAGAAAEAVFSVGKKQLQLFASPIVCTDRRDDGSAGASDGNNAGTASDGNNAINGKVQGAVLLVMDVTEREDREKLRREFTANVSHELKTPLTAVSGYAEIMAEGLAKPEDTQRFARNIYREARRMITLVGDIMTLSHLDEAEEKAKKGEADESAGKEKVDLFSLAQNAVERIEEAAQSRNISVTLTGGPAEVSGIRRVLEEMAFNLLDNAVKYNRDGGEIRVSVTTEEGAAVFSVSDTGIGIPAASRDRIFERFYRVDTSRSKAVEGTGLGLSIVKHGAALHNASVEVQSRENSGSCFTLRFRVS